MAVTEQQVWEALRNCYDPEIPVNIVDLGLVYGVQVADGAVHVQMTLTAMGCPAHGMISQNVQAELEKIPGVTDAQVEIVWDPPWEPSRMSEEARRKLGIS